MKVMIVGGVAGGASCAARLRRLDEKAEIIMVERGPHVSYANCGLPYRVGDVIEKGVLGSEIVVGFGNLTLFFLLHVVVEPNLLDAEAFELVEEFYHQIELQAGLAGSIFGVDERLEVEVLGNIAGEWMHFCELGLVVKEKHAGIRMPFHHGCLEHGACIAAKVTECLLSAVPVPDPKVQKARKRIALAGEVPDPLNPPAGCRFETRCPYASELCRKAEPSQAERNPGHYSACWNR